MAEVRNKENEDAVDFSKGFKMTELGLLPEEWRIAKINDIFEIQQGKSLSPEHRAKKPLYPFLRTANVLWGQLELSVIDKMNFTEEEIQRLRLLPGDLLVCEGGDIGRTAIWQGELQLCCYQNHIHRLRAKCEEVEPEFYMYWMQAAVLLFGLYLGQGNKTTIPNLSKSRLGSFEVPLPPLPEQRTIAHVLRTVQRAKEATERVIQATRELKKSLMRYLFTYGPVPMEEAGRVPLKETEIGLVPEHWEVVRLGEAATVKYGKARPKTQGNVPVIGSGGIYGWTATSLVDFPTLVIGRKGTAGEVWLVECPCWPSDTTFYLDWKKRVNVRFLFNYLHSNKPSGEHAKTTLPSLQRHDVEALLIPFPPLLEQGEICLILRAVDKKLQAEEARKQALEALFKSLLNNLMTGKIRVKDVVLPNVGEGKGDVTH